MKCAECKHFRKEILECYFYGMIVDPDDDSYCEEMEKTNDIE